MVQELNLDGRTDLEKESIIYSYVLEYLKYKITKVRVSNEEPLHQALKGNGVCISYAMLFKAMCEAAGISAGSHAWNMIEIDGQYYLCDPTWSDTMRRHPI